MLLGVSAIILPHYRTFLIIIYAPAFLMALYFWLVPESVRWLIVSGQYERAMIILNRTAKQNNRQISDKSLEILRKNIIDAKKTNDNESDCSLLLSIFYHRILIARLFLCSTCWVLIVFTYFGLSVNATKIADDDNKYLTYITTMIAELPAAIITFFLLKYIGRRMAMCFVLCTAGIVIIFVTFVPTQYTSIIRIMFFIGMCATSSAFGILYVFSAEIWPTAIRNTMMNICSMIGRLGSMVAPLAILLVILFFFML